MPFPIAPRSIAPRIPKLIFKQADDVLLNPQLPYFLPGGGPNGPDTQPAFLTQAYGYAGITALADQISKSGDSLGTELLGLFWKNADSIMMFALGISNHARF